MAENKPAAARGEAKQFILDAIQHQEKDSCLYWPFHFSGNYPSIKFMGRHGGVHNHVCRFTHGEPPSEFHQTAHECGQGALGCINPHHLAWKTAKENSADRILHGTQQRGEMVGNSKLSAADVVEIRRLCVKRGDAVWLATKFGVDRTNIYAIINGKTWRHVL